jgi:glycine betaine/proline transport system substrate-binding protein
LKYLKDPKGVYPKDACSIISRRGFKTNLRQLLFSKNFNLEEEHCTR